MATHRHIVITIWRVTCLLGTTALANLPVTFYESPHFIGLLSEFTPTDNACINLSRPTFDRATSLTTKTCVILHTEEQCSGNSIKVESGSYPDLVHVTHGANQHFSKLVRSFRPCNPELASEGAAHVAMYNGNDLIGEYKDICDCVTLPTLTDPSTRLDNHGTCIQLYLSAIGETGGCSGKFTTLEGGTSFLSENLRNLTHTPTSWRRIAAISPCIGVSSKCFKLISTVTKFVVDSDPNRASVMASATDVSMSTTTKFQNNGSAVVSEEYRATMSVLEATETTLVKNFSSMFNWSVETGVTTEFSSDIPMIAKTSVSASLKSAYSGLLSQSQEEGYLAKRETTTEFSVSQKIEIGPCTEYNVNSFLKMVQNFPINYLMYSKVKGTVAERKLTAGEIKSRLVGMEWISDYDNYTILVTGRGTMLVNYGVETMIDAEGAPIWGCQQRQGDSLPRDANAGFRSQGGAAASGNHLEHFTAAVLYFVSFLGIVTFK